MIPIPKTLNEGTDCYRLFAALRSGEPKSHQELYALHMIVHSRASDLRLKHGCLIDTWRDGATTWYQLRAVREGEDAPADSASPLGPSLDAGTVLSLGDGEQDPEADPGSFALPGGQGQPSKQLEIWEAAA